MAKYNIFYDADAIDEAFSNSPFRLKNDVKDLSETELAEIAKGIGDELVRGFGRKTCVLLYNKGQKYVLGFAKVRCGDEKHKKGKSNGYRCIVLVDSQNELAYLLHIFTHSVKDNISKKESNSLKKLVDEYIDSIGK